MSGDKARAGLIGWPVDHSISPAMQNAAFRALGLDWHYDLLPTPPGEVGSLLAGLAARGYRGANVTVPHKGAVLPFLARVEGEARAIGAANTLVLQDEGPASGWAGHNTDAAGFIGALREGGFEPEGAAALVLGAGGAARAVVHALLSAGCRVAIYNRTAETARRLAAELRPAGGLRACVIPSPDALEPDAVDLLVNATPLGMGAAAGASPWPEPLPLPAHWTVYDLVYSPAETRLLARARAAGAAAVGGLGMLVYQGALAFELWTGQPAPLAAMWQAARQALGAATSGVM
jgi:shikimate dehydrogenase